VPYRIILYEVGRLAVDGLAVTFGTARRGLGAVPNVTAQSSTASVPITVLLYNGPSLCSFNVTIKVKGLKPALHYRVLLRAIINISIPSLNCFTTFLFQVRSAYRTARKT